MPEILPGHAPIPRAVIGWDGAAYRVFAVDATGHLNVNVLANVGLDDALQSVATDRLLVRGMDQLFSIAGPLGKNRSAIVSGAGGFSDSDSVPGGELWIVTTAAAEDFTNPLTKLILAQRHNAVDSVLSEDRRAILADEWSTWSGLTTLDVGDVVRAYCIGSLAGDTINVTLSGYIMTVET